jgi:plasmid stabilization system protein ParE
MKIVIRPEARREILDAKSWYEARSAGLGLEFARSVDDAIAQASRTPHRFATIGSEFRHVILRKFPYSIIYHASESELVIVSCFHHRRRPGSWLPK